MLKHVQRLPFPFQSKYQIIPPAFKTSEPDPHSSVQFDFPPPPSHTLCLMQLNVPTAPHTYPILPYSCVFAHTASSSWNSSSQSLYIQTLSVYQGQTQRTLPPGSLPCSPQGELIAPPSQYPDLFICISHMTLLTIYLKLSVYVSLTQ